MKPLLLVILMFGHCLPTYSQLSDSVPNKQFKTDTTFSDLSLKNTLENLNSGGFLGLIPSFKNSMADEESSFPDSWDNYGLGQDQTSFYEKPSGSYNMPLVKPQGVFPMPIDRPDSTADYTLKIKDF